MNVWWFAFGYFACYLPYSALTKALSGQVSGFALLPISALASVAAAATFLVGSGWWRHAGRRGGVPCPSFATLVSGLCTATIIVTTTLSYTIPGASIVVMMLLMRGGVLGIAPIVDASARRRIRPRSAVALGLCAAALLVGVGVPGSWQLPPLALGVTAIYVAAYFGRLRLMSALAKRDDAANMRYFVEEQLVATPAVALALTAIALAGSGNFAAELRAGFALIDDPIGAGAVLVGVLSQGTGIFGGLILLSPQENSWCVPVNRASSVLAGVGATALLAIVGRGGPPPGRELAGAAHQVGAIELLALPQRVTSTLASSVSRA
jgi:hypothetical protein